MVVTLGVRALTWIWGGIQLSLSQKPSKLGSISVPLHQSLAQYQLLCYTFPEFPRWSWIVGIPILFPFFFRPHAALCCNDLFSRSYASLPSTFRLRTFQLGGSLLYIPMAQQGVQRDGNLTDQGSEDALLSGFLQRNQLRIFKWSKQNASRLTTERKDLTKVESRSRF